MGCAASSAPAGEALMVAGPPRAPLSPVVTVPEGCYGLVERLGRAIDCPATGAAVWPPGSHWAPPYVRVSHLVTQRPVALPTRVTGAVSKDSVLCDVDLAVEVRVLGDAARGEDPGLVRVFAFHEWPGGGGGPQQLLRAALEEAVRALVVSLTHDQARGLQGGLAGAASGSASGSGSASASGSASGAADGVAFAKSQRVGDVRDALNEQFNRLGVEITTVAVTGVQLPAAFQSV